MLPPESSRRNGFVLGGRQKRGHAGEAHSHPCLPDRRRRILEPPMGELRLSSGLTGSRAETRHCALTWMPRKHAPTSSPNYRTAGLSRSTRASPPHIASYVLLCTVGPWGAPRT